MRQQVKVEIDGKPYIVKELSVRQIIEIKDKVSSSAGIADIINIFVSTCTDIPNQSLLDLTFTDIETLVKAIKEVNASFFKIPGHLGLKEIADQMLENLKASLIKDWNQATIHSLKN